MNVEEVNKIKNLISKAELENAKSEGKIESIKKEWMEKYGFETLEEATEKLNELNKELELSDNRINKLYNELLSCIDWEQLKQELN